MLLQLYQHRGWNVWYWTRACVLEQTRFVRRKKEDNVRFSRECQAVNAMQASARHTSPQRGPARQLLCAAVLLPGH